MLLLRLEGEGVDDFLSNDNVGGDVPVLNESSLRMINIVRKMRFKSVSE
jgi:hypothetical protein